MKRRFAAVIAAVLILAISLLGCGTKKPAQVVQKEEKYTPVEINKAEKKSISNLSTLSGKVFADKDVVVLPKTPGKVASVNVKTGDSVKTGQVLFALNDEDAQKQVDIAKAAMNTSKSALDTSSSAFDMAKANYDINNEKLQNLKLNLDRTKTLYESGAVSKAQYESAQLQASDKQIDLYKAQLNQAQASYNQAQAAYNQAQVNYNQAVQALDNTYVKSPIDGIVSGVNVQVGTMTSSIQIPVSVVNMDIVNVQINVTEDIIKSLALDQDVKVTISGASANGISGKISNISPTADTKTQLYPIKINIDNKDKSIKPGMFAKVELNTDTKQNVIIVKGESVVEKNGKKYVYVIEDDKAVQKEVTVGLDTGSLMEIKTGLTEGESVITKGQNYVENGTKVKVVRGDK